VSLGSTGIGLALLRTVNAALGLCLSLALAAVFGVSREADALFVALSVAVFLARDLSRVVRTAAVPCLVECDEGHGSPDFPAMFQAATLVLAAGGTALAWGAAPWIVRLTSPGFDAESAGQAQRLLRLLSPSLLLFMLFGSAQAAFHARRHFLVPEATETLWRVIAISALFTLGHRWGVEAYAVGLLLAAFIQWFALLVVGALHGLQVLPTRGVQIRSSSLRPFWLGAVVVLCSVGQLQIEGVLDRAVLSFMEPGSIALFSYAERLAHMAPMLLSTSLLIPWLPEIARIRARVGDPLRLAKQGSLFMAALGVLLAMVISWAARDAVTFLLLRGKFDADSGDIVVLALRVFALGIPAIFCVQCLAGLYIVERNLKAMIRMGLVAVLAHAAGNLALRRWGVPGIAASGSLTIWVVAFYLWWRIRSREPVWFDWPRFAGAVAAAAVLLYAIPWAAFLPWVPMRVAAGATAAWAAYTAVLWPALRCMQNYERKATGSGPAYEDGRTD
jgi:putative peptidoglycan lipid II flippase